jgi:hypothetical protein
MKRSASVIIAAILLCGAFAQRARSQTETAKKSPDASVSGRITIKGKPAGGVMVGLRPVRSVPPDSPFKATTDQDGKFRFAGVPPGNYQLMPAVSEFVISDNERAWGLTVVVSEGDSIVGVDFDLVRGGVITGKVTDADGRPVAEETVNLLDDSGRSANWSMSRISRTDDRGIYRVFGVRPGRYKVSVGSESFGPLRSTGTGRIVPITFYPDVPDAAKATVVEVGEGTEATNIDITLAAAPRTFSVSGRVVDAETSKPITNVTISLMKIMIIDARSRSSQGGGTGVLSKSNGEFTLEGLPAGKYSISIAPPPESNLRAESVSFDLVDEDLTGLLIKTTTGASISGTVVLATTPNRKNDGPAPTSLSVYLENAAEGFSFNQYSQIKADGSFQVGGLNAGKVGFSVEAFGPFGDGKRIPILRIERDGVVQANGLQIQAGEHITGVRVVVAYGGGSIRGVVKVENGTLPPDGRLLVHVAKVGDSSPSGSGTEADARGRFLIDALAPGTYELTVFTSFRDGRQKPRIIKQMVTVNDDAPTDVLLTLDLAAPNSP